MTKKRRTQHSEVEKEYRRLRKNMIARLRYREKQGFKVDYTTKPRLKQRVTQADIERLQESKLQINKRGEVVINPPKKQTRTMRDITRADVSTAKQELERFNQPPQSTHPKSQPEDVDMDYVGMVYGVISDLFDRAQAFQDEYQPEYSASWNAEEFYNAWVGVYELLIETVEDEIMRVGEERLNAYYKTALVEISTEVSQLLQGTYSDPDQVTNSESVTTLQYLLKCS